MHLNEKSAMMNDHSVYCFIRDVLLCPDFMMSLSGQYDIVFPDRRYADVLGQPHCSLWFKLEEDAVAAQTRFGFSEEQYRDLNNRMTDRAKLLKLEDDIVRRELSRMSHEEYGILTNQLYTGKETAEIIPFKAMLDHGAS